MNEPDDLLAAVDRISKPEKTAHWVSGHVHSWNPFECDDDSGLYVCRWCDETSDSPTADVPAESLVRRVDPPLLERLRLAVVSNLGGNGGGKQARERTPMDVGAFTLYEDIDGRIRSWLSELGERLPASATAAEAIRRWYVLWLSSSRAEAASFDRARTIDAWTAQIRDKLDSPKRIEITAPCPSCGEEWVNIGLKLEDGSDDPDDVERVRALAAVERETIDDSYASCAACRTVWMGVGRMRALRIAIDDAESAAKATVSA